MADTPTPQILQTTELSVMHPDQPGRVVELLIQLADARAIVSQLQDELAEARRELAQWQPLRDAYERDAAGQRACRFKVLTLDEWIAERVSRLGGDWLRGEDGQDVADHQDGE